MSEPGAPPSPQLPRTRVVDALLDAAGNVANDLPCYRCRYNVRGLQIDGRCPECGAAISSSLHGHLLAFAHPQHLRNITRGLRVLFVAIFFLAVCAFINAAMIAVGLTIDLLVFPIVGNLLFLIGAWMIAEPDIDRLGNDCSSRSLKIIRFAVTVGVFSRLFAFIPFSDIATQPKVLMYITLLGMDFLARVTVSVAVFNYLSELAQRLPDAPLARRARSLMWASGVYFGLKSAVAAQLLFGETLWIYRNTSPVILALCAEVMFLSYGVVSLFVLRRMLKAFRHAGQLAEISWKRGNAAPLSC